MSQQMLETLDQVIKNGLEQGLIHHMTENESLSGRFIRVNSRDLINFGSCSYMGLEQHPLLKEGCIEATLNYGTQFSSSRTYISLGLYQNLESLLQQIFQKPVVVSASTTLGHCSALPTLVGDKDVVILDMQVHSSIQMAAQLLKARNIPIHIIQHNDMDRLEQKIKQLKATHHKIWYLADGVYSMYGDFAPLQKLVELMEQYDQFYTYIDDAHGMSWAGKNGCGLVRSQIEHHSKMVLAVSLNKAFACAGGALVLPNPEWASKVKNCGGTLIFSGPIQPPMLGAACASAQLHLSNDFPQLQQELQELVEYTNQRLEEYGVPQFEKSHSPLFFIPTGFPRILYNIINRLLSEGLYINSASFPATPMRKGGLRFMINRCLTKTDIDQLTEAIAVHYPQALKEEGSSFDEVSKLFNIPEFEVKKVNTSPRSTVSEASKHTLRTEIHRSVQEIDAEKWNALFAGKGNFTTPTLEFLEKTFNLSQAKKEDQWEYFYCFVYDNKDELVLATYYTLAQIKDDMFAKAVISKQIENERQKSSPYYLTSSALLLGSLMTKGEHLYLNREHSDWKSALSLLTQQMQKVAEERNCSQIMFREFRKGNDEALKKELYRLGYIELNLPELCTIEDLSWKDHHEYLQRLGQKYRHNVRKEILAFEDRFEFCFEKPQSETEIQECYSLYNQVYQKSYELNVFQLPLSFFQAISKHPQYDIIRLYLKTETPTPFSERKPVAVMFSFIEADVYFALVVGLDYSYLKSHNTYKQILYQTVKRSWDLKCKSLDLAFTAILEKKKIGARPHPMCAYVQMRDHYNQAVIASMSIEKEV